MNTAVESMPIAEVRTRRSIPRSVLWLSLSLLVLVAGWLLPLDHYITPRSGLGYALGIIGGSMMLALLVYPARKRMPSLAALGSPRTWFRIHMVLGVVGPLAILYHSTYRLGAANSNVALISMLIVAGSGLVGRYLYGRIHHGLYGRAANLKELREDAARIKSAGSGTARLLPELGPRIDAAEQAIDRGVLLVPKALAALLVWRWQRRSLHRYIRRTLRRGSVGSPALARHRRSFTAAAMRYADTRLSAARRVAEFQSCARLFSLWHVLHIPLFGMLFIAGVVHVIAVNIY